jgi:hypothetical protein
MSTQLLLCETLWLDKEHEEHPDWVLDALMGQGARYYADLNRKLRLLAAARCRRLWSLLQDERSRAAIMAAEEYADARIDRSALAKGRDAAERVVAALVDQDTASAHAARAAARVAADAPHDIRTECFYGPRASMSGRRAGRGAGVFDVVGVVEAIRTTDAEAHVEHYHLLWDVFGNPFQPVCLDDAWCTPTVETIARAAYGERLPSGALDNARLAVLADALEESGCSAQAILDHLRCPGIHVRGCWPVDRILGKE